MVDTVANATIAQTKKRLVVVSTILSDGTGTADAILVDKSTFTGPDGTEPGRLVVEKIEYQIDGMQMQLEFEHATDDLIATLTGQGVFDFSQNGKYQGFVDPQTGTTGDIVVTSVGHTALDKAMITLYLRKKD